MKKEKKSDYDLNMNDYSQIYDYNLITLRVITQLCHLYSILNKPKKNFQKYLKILCYAAEQICSLVFNYENMQ